MYRKYYSKFIAANPSAQHYVAHSHHYWPDVTLDATMQYWLDSARFVDDKWNYFFTEKVPHVQKRIAEVLNLSEPKQIVFAPNTHEFVHRILSCFDPKKKIRILTTDSEFYSFDRQVNRLEEDDLVSITRIPTQPFHNFESRFKEAAEKADYDLIFFSQVFFNSGFVVQDLNAIISAVKNLETIIVVDGYHGFMAVPTDLKSIQDRAFYLTGSYKYAQGGEGCCFMTVPKNCQLRPAYTGWFAGFAELTGAGGVVSYANDGNRFAGSTMDFSALYRLSSVLDLFFAEHLTVQKIHNFVQSLQLNFREQLQHLNDSRLSEDKILRHDFLHHGHFFAFELGAADAAKNLHAELNKKGIRTDYRGSRLRFGFGLYQDSHVKF